MHRPFRPEEPNSHCKQRKEGSSSGRSNERKWLEFEIVTTNWQKINVIWVERAKNVKNLIWKTNEDLKNIKTAYQNYQTTNQLDFENLKELK
jgi:hypothetical protein